MYEDIFGSTMIRDTEHDNLKISIDVMDKPVAVFLYTPSMRETKCHYHIEMDKKQAIELRTWLNSFIADGAVEEKIHKDTRRNCEKNKS